MPVTGLDDTHVGAADAETDGGRKEPEKERKKMKKSFWKRPVLHLCLQNTT